eukprot:Nitzschia sp. Nitz4//scaffold3_size479765//210652//211794//NITZ4_000089-RA/size479765-processed-gene-1.507-mRNA-1//-1//CDS//3329550725//7290//frame0
MASPLPSPIHGSWHTTYRLQPSAPNTHPQFQQIQQVTMATAPAPASEASTAKSTAKTATKASGAGTKTKKAAAPRRKKPTAKSTGASQAQAAFLSARGPQLELASQRNAAAVRLADPLWYRVEDVLPATTDETPMAIPATKILPEQVQIVEAALANNHMARSDVTPQAFCVLLEQARRYALELIADAQDYAVCAGRAEMAKADFDLASQMRPDHPISVTTQLPKLNLLAQQINRVPLPPIPTQCYSGVLLPLKRHQLTARTFDVVSGAQVAQKMVQAKPSIATKKSSSSSSSKSSPKPSYGASRGRQIPVHLKDATPDNKQAAPSTTSSSGTTPGGTMPMDVSSPGAMAVGSSVKAADTPHSAPTAASNAPGSAPSSGGL